MTLKLSIPAARELRQANLELQIAQANLSSAQEKQRALMVALGLPLDRPITLQDDNTIVELPALTH